MGFINVKFYNTSNLYTRNLDLLTFLCNCRSYLVRNFKRFYRVNPLKCYRLKHVIEIIKYLQDDILKFLNLLVAHTSFSFDHMHKGRSLFTLLYFYELRLTFFP